MPLKTERQGEKLTHTHTHTHTQREREGEREKEGVLRKRNEIQRGVKVLPPFGYL